MKGELRKLLLVGLALVDIATACPAPAQSACGEPQVADYFEPLTDGEGVRYPLTIGPLSWRLMGYLQPVKGSDGLIHLAYTLQFTNSWSSKATVKSIEVVDPARNNAATGKNQVVTVKNEDVTGQLRLLSLRATLDKANYTTEIPSGQSAIGYFDVTYSDASQVPRAIAHRVTVSALGQQQKAQDFNTLSPPIRVDCREPVVLAPPFKGHGWVNGNGCCRQIGPHRFVMNSVNGSLAPTEEFAIDWIKINSQGKFFHGDPKDPKNWPAYGVDLLAVAPGTVVEVMNDVQDTVPGKHPENLSTDQIAGNRVIIDLGFGRFAEYDHLVPHSATVKVGDYVHQGQKIGLLGNSGNSDAPHLHFQLMDRPSSLDGSALPFVFDSMQMEGRISASLDELDILLVKAAPVAVDASVAKPLMRTMPLSLDVVGFQ